MRCHGFNGPDGDGFRRLTGSATLARVASRLV